MRRKQPLRAFCWGTGGAATFCKCTAGKHRRYCAGNAVNNVNVLNSILEDNAGPGIVVSGGFTVNLEGNTIESSGGPAVASDAYALNVQTILRRQQLRHESSQQQPL